MPAASPFRRPIPSRAEPRVGLRPSKRVLRVGIAPRVASPRRWCAVAPKGTEPWLIEGAIPWMESDRAAEWITEMCDVAGCR